MATLTISDRMDEIARSKILAKAIVEKDGKFQIVAIFEKSYEYCFAIVFTARSKRSPRKCWKRTGQYHIVSDARRYDPRGIIKEAGFDLLLDSRYSSWSRKVRYYHRRQYVNTFIRRIAFPFEFGIERIFVPGARYERANRITSGRKRLGRYG